MEQSHTSAVNVLHETKKFILIIPVGAFRLLLQGILQPVIKLKGCQVQCITPSTAEPGFTLLDMLTNPDKSKNLPMAEYGIWASINRKSSQFEVPEKKLWTALKGVKYESGFQRKRRKSKSTMTPDRFKEKAHDSSEDSSSSSSSDDEEQEAKAKKHWMGKKSKWKMVTWQEPKLTSHTRLPSGPFTPTNSYFPLLYSKFSIPGSLLNFWTSPQNYKQLHKF